MKQIRSYFVVLSNVYNNCTFSVLVFFLIQSYNLISMKPFFILNNYSILIKKK